MDNKEKLKQEFEIFRKNFGLTEEEIDGLIEFYEEEKPKSKRVLNTIRSDDKK